MAAGGGAEPEKAAAGRRAPGARRRVSVVARHVAPGGSADGAASPRPLAEVAASEDGQAGGATSAPLDLEGAKFAAIQSLRTGNPTRDMLTAMMIPLAFKVVTDCTGNIGKAVEQFMDYMKKPPQSMYTRRIEVEQKVNQWGYSFSNDDSRNTVLVRAITLYLADKELKFRDASVSLIRIKENPWDSDSDGDDEDKDSRSFPGQLKKNYRLTRSAPEEQWVTVEPGVMFMKTTEEPDQQGKEVKCTTKKITLSLQSSTEEQVDAFVDKAYSWYLGELRKMQDHSRYMYELVAISSKKEEGDEGGDSSARKYRRFKLSDEKTFKSLFFPEKETLLKLLEDFTEKKGKYSIPGYPHKLGVLCHGPPGTGKTSMIKAMANHLQRNIVNVPLARIQTNSELMDVMFDTRYQVLGQEVPIKLRFKDVIFVMEDVDAISKIVHKRDSKDGSAASGLVVPPAPAPAPGAGGLESVKEEGKEAAAADGEAKEEPKKETPKKEEEACAGVDDDVDESKKDDPMAALVSMLAPVQGPTKDGSGGTSALSGAGSDKLNLSGILNALDGVVDSPNRILIMTSNHPEKLDPALIRPGRIDKKFLLGYMSGFCCAQMVAHYFQSALAESDVKRIGELVDGGASRPGLQITPARLEQLCAEHETVDSLCLELQKLLSGFDSTGKPLTRLALSRTPSVSVEDSLARSQTEPPTPVIKRW